VFRDVKRPIPKRLRVLVSVITALVLVAVIALVAHGQSPTGSTTQPPSSSDAHHRGDPVPSSEGDFRRFRLGSVAGERLTPNRDDFAARTVSNGPLLLFFPATGSRPSHYQLFLAEAEDAGYHVLGLDYWNLGRTLSGTCGQHPRCYTQVQRNRFDGDDSSALSHVGPEGSIVSRFRDAISHLQTVDPAGGWAQFVRSDGEIDWRHIVVAGHSQGGGMAAFIAHSHEVEGALMFSSPVESNGRFHASWMNHPGVTPVSREFALDSASDRFGPKIWGSWKVLGLDGRRGPWRTRTAAPSAGRDPHAIITTTRFVGGVDAHSAIIADATPLDANGDPQFLSLWRWMLHRFPLPAVHQDAARSATDGSSARS
jgi:hypothetical protein